LLNDSPYFPVIQQFFLEFTFVFLFFLVGDSHGVSERGEKTPFLDRGVRSTPCQRLGQ